MKQGNGKQPAVVLFSGGLDSTTVLAMALDQGFAPVCLSFDYGQRQQVELEAARRVARVMGAARHLVLRLDLGTIGGSALTDPDLEVPRDRTGPEMEEGVPVTYVPARNLIFLSHAVALAEVLEARDIFIGVNAVDFSGYPDCRPDFIQAFARAARLGTRAGVEQGGPRIHTPLIVMSKAEIIRTGMDLGVDYSLTHSCYDPQDGLACGRCDACLLRARGFAQAGVEDPTRYVGGGGQGGQGGQRTEDR